MHTWKIVQDVDEFDKSCTDRRMPNKRCFKLLKISLAGHMEVLVKEFIRIGANNCEKFLDESTSKANKGIFAKMYWTLCTCIGLYAHAFPTLSKYSFAFLGRKSQTPSLVKKVK
jgi:hypothetical protein